MINTRQAFCRFVLSAFRTVMIGLAFSITILAVTSVRAQPSHIEVGNELVDNIDLFDLVGDAQAANDGQWSEVASWPLNGLHAALLPTGQVITYGSNPLRVEGGFVYDLWDPERGLQPASHTTLAVQTGNDIFCSAQQLLPGSGGMLLVTGGTVSYEGQTNLGIDAASVFDPLTNRFFDPFNRMHRTRWYPTLSTMGNGMLLSHGGRDKNRLAVDTPELFDPSTGRWRLLTGATSVAAYGGGGWNYPRTFMAPNGKALVMPNRKTEGYYLDTTGTGSLTEVIQFDEKANANGNLAVMYRENRVLIIRGRDARILTLLENGNINVKDVADLSQDRFWAEATILANGEVMVTGGSTTSQNRDTAVRYAEIWNPNSERWRSAAEATEARLYHSASVLLPSGAVVTGGGNPGGNIQQPNAEVYYPDYLFNANNKFALRPRLLGVVPETDGRSIIEVRARGDEGTEEFNLLIDGRVFRTFRVSKEMRSYFLFRNQETSGSQVRVEFVNDEFDPPLIDTNLNVDYMEIDGVRHETQNFNVESLNLGEVGHFQNETLFTNGYFNYWDRDPANKIPGSVIEVRASGNEGTEEIRLLINNLVVKTFEATTSMQSYYYRHIRPVTGDQIKVELVSNRRAAALDVDFIKIDGFIHPTEHPSVFSENDVDEGFLQTETLPGSGFFQYWDRSPPNLQMGVVDYGSRQRLFYDSTATIDNVMLIRFGSATHSFDMGQLAVRLDFDLKLGRQIEIEMPDNPITCPPGYYLMFAVNDQGVPSKAAILELQNR